MSKLSFVLLLFFVQLNAIKSQESSQWGLMPSLNLSKKLPKDWSLHAKVESRIKVYQDETDFSYQRTDLSLIAGRKLRVRATLSMGYLIKTEPDAISHRTIQQLALTKRYDGFALAHRFAADQTFQKNEATAFRFRYRLGVELPLQGQSVDPGEFYVKFSNEYLFTLEGNANDLEIRLTGAGGYSLGKHTKLEFGPEYRLDSFIHSASRQRIWLVINLFQSF